MKLKSEMKSEEQQKKNVDNENRFCWENSEYLCVYESRTTAAFYNNSLFVCMLPPCVRLLFIIIVNCKSVARATEIIQS